MPITLAQIRTGASNDLGWESAPNPALAAMDNFINRVCDDIYSRQKWSWRRVSTTLTFTGSTATLPADFALDGDGILTFPQQGQNIVYTKVDEASKDLYQNGSYVYWITYDSGTSLYNLTVSETSPGSLPFVYDATAVAMTQPTDTTRIPSLNVILAGVKARMIKYLDQEQNNVAERREYEDEILKLRAVENRTVSKRAISVNEQAGTYLGDIDVAD